MRTLPKAARGWLGAPGGSHPFDFGGADSTAFHRLDAAGLARCRGKRRGGAHAPVRPDPATWREPRRMYDVTVTGVAEKPSLKFYDRGTWQQAVELGP